MAYNTIPPAGFPDIPSMNELDGKVDKVPGKGLSTNDYTDADKAIVDGVESDIEALQEQVDELAEEVAEIMPFDYSTTEKKTGQKWIDGKDIYCKVVEFGTLPNNTTKSVSSGLSNVNIIKIDTITYGSNAFVTIPYLSASTNNKIEISYNSDNTISIIDNADFSAHSAYITLYYTKTT